jgi:hypothetical protein
MHTSKFAMAAITLRARGLAWTWFTTSDVDGPPRRFSRRTAIGSLAKVYGAITFILDHPDAVEAYLKGQDRILEDSRPNTTCRRT